ncbi:DUF4956 domain-containing protein [Candidatus Pelagibacter sp.]|nr:DUF4956 domain-containing protein [Candidatus Pelagibacter sp.]
MDKLEKYLAFEQLPEEPLIIIIFNLILCMIVLSIISWFYKKFSQSVGGKTFVGSILPLIGLTVFLVIVVIKNSLALSLGLVGALSIVRFRTPIKEPEELGYLFLTIAVGLGFGAGYKLITTIIVSMILLYLYYVSKKSNKINLDGEYTILVNIDNKKLDECSKLITEQTVAFKITRLETNNEKISVYYNVSVNSNFNLEKLIFDLNLLDKNSNVDFVEMGVNW